MAVAADADWVSVHTDTASAAYGDGTFNNSISFGSNVTDVQAIRIVRQGQSYIVVLTRTYQQLRLDLYDFTGQRLERTVVRTLADPYRIGADRLEYKHTNGVSYLQVRYIRVNDISDQPITYHRKRYRVRPNQPNRIALQASTKQTITALQSPASETSASIVSYLSAARLLSGMLPIIHDASLDHGCELHAEYMRLNDDMTHYETEGNPGYTTDGAATGPISVITYQYTDSITSAIDLWLKAPYHRFDLLYPELISVGWAMSDVLPSDTSWDKYFACMNIISGAEVIAHGYEKNITYWNYDNHEPIPYPGVNQTETPVIFSGSEEPDPLEALGGSYPVGYPISLIFPLDDTIEEANLILTDEQGNTVTGYLRTPYEADDPNQYYQGNAILFMPTVPLEYNATYTVTATATRNQAAYEKTWSFSTAAME